MVEDFDERALAHASTPLRAMALSEVSADVFRERTAVTGIGDNLDLLERVIPADCLDLECAHAHFDREVFIALCARWPLADAVDRNCRAEGQRTSLLLKASLAILGGADPAASAS